VGVRSGQFGLMAVLLLPVEVAGLRSGPVLRSKSGRKQGEKNFPVASGRTRALKFLHVCRHYQGMPPE